VGINGAADECSVARARRHIDRRCSIDTAYPFQSYRGQVDLYTGTRGWLGSRRVTRTEAAEGCKGQREGGCGTDGWWRCSTLRP